MAADVIQGSHFAETRHLGCNTGRPVLPVDSGIGIPSSNLPRIFERFYVVDKSRSKKLGGTGLGLPIVKHIVLLNGGTIDIESSQGIGTKFTIVLPHVQPVG